MLWDTRHIQRVATNLNQSAFHLTRRRRGESEVSMDPSLRMVFVAGALMLALLAAIVSSVSVDPISMEPRTVDAGPPNYGSQPAARPQAL